MFIEGGRESSRYVMIIRIPSVMCSKNYGKPSRYDVDLL